MALDNEDIKQLIAILQRGLTPDDSDEIEAPQKKTTRNSKPKAAAKPKTKNKFDNMPEFEMFKEDTEFDRKIKKPLPSARLRAFEPIKVRCRVCGKNEKVAPNLVESIERYKCNKCSTGAG
jgi:hypothetical protein